MRRRMMNLPYWEEWAQQTLFWCLLVSSILRVERRLNRKVKWRGQWTGTLSWFIRCPSVMGQNWFSPADFETRKGCHTTAGLCLGGGGEKPVTEQSHHRGASYKSTQCLHSRSSSFHSFHFSIPSPPMLPPLLLSPLWNYFVRRAC
jgi:hypothetical protein